MATEAQRSATSRYRKKIKESGEFKRIFLEFYPPEREMYEWLKAHRPTATYIKGLIRKDMEK